MTHNRFVAIALVMAACTPSMALCQEKPFEAEAEAAFAPVIKQYKIPGVVVGVTRNGKHSFYATGLASRADNRPATPDTLFELIKALLAE